MGFTHHSGAKHCDPNDKDPSFTCFMKTMGHGVAVAGHDMKEGFIARGKKIKAKEKQKAGEKLTAMDKKLLGIVGKIDKPKKPKGFPTATSIGQIGAIPASLVGNKKCGHGGFCHMNKIKNKEGARLGGEGLKRVGKQLA